MLLQVLNVFCADASRIFSEDLNSIPLNEIDVSVHKFDSNEMFSKPLSNQEDVNCGVDFLSKCSYGLEPCSFSLSGRFCACKSCNSDNTMCNDISGNIPNQIGHK